MIHIGRLLWYISKHCYDTYRYIAMIHIDTLLWFISIMSAHALLWNSGSQL